MGEYTIAVVSGGMDSVTLAYELVHRGHRVDMVSFDYGQRHVRELDCARQHADWLGLRHDVVDLSNITRLIATSSLTSPDMDVPDGHYAEDTMRRTVVPNRNSIMLNVAAAIAVSRQATGVATGIHAGDHYIYPDCRPEFRDTLETMLRVANHGFAQPEFTVVAPFINVTKADIVERGDQLAVNWSATWSCYKGGNIHCGACGTCFERREAFADAGVPDPTVYESHPDYADPR